MIAIDGSREVASASAAVMPRLYRDGDGVLVGGRWRGARFGADDDSEVAWVPRESLMTIVRVAAVQAAYILMDQAATLDRVETLVADAAAQQAELVVFPEAFVPGNPIWIDTRPIWDGDDDWYRLLVDNAVVVPSAATERLANIAREHAVWLVVGVDERDPHGMTIYDSVLTFAPNGDLVDKHRKLVPTGSERTVWGMGDGSTLNVTQAPFGRFGGLICWENYMPLARFYMYAKGIDIWLAPTFAQGDGWIATLRHIARENAMFVIGVNTLLHVNDIPAGFPDREKLVSAEYREENGEWLEPGNSVIIDPNGVVLVGPIHEREETLIADLDLGKVASTRRMRDPVGHYHRPDIFRLSVDTAPRTAIIETTGATS